MATSTRKKAEPAQLPADHDDRNQQTPGVDMAEVKLGLADSMSGYNNLGLWDALKRTDPKATKPFQRAGGFRGTQIDPVFRIQLMTETFGPVGKGWGFEQLEWTIAERMVFICLRAWYVDPSTGEKHFTGPQWGGTELVRRNRDGTERPDDEAFKMSTTDALGKCLLQIGVSADVYMGQFDDSKYKDENEQFFAAKNAIKNNPDLQPAGIEKFEADVKEQLDACHDLEALDEYWKSGVNARIREIGTVDKAAQNRLISAFSQRKNEIVKKQEQQHAVGHPADPDNAPPPAGHDHGGEDDGEDDEDEIELVSPEEASAIVTEIKARMDACKDEKELGAYWDNQDVQDRFKAGFLTKMHHCKKTTDAQAAWNSGINRILNRLKIVDMPAYEHYWKLISDKRDEVAEADDSPGQKSA